MKTIKIAVFAKSIDGGTGTYFLSLLKLNKQTVDGKTILIKSLVLEEPTYRNFKKSQEEKILFLREKDFYGGVYNIFSKHFINFVEELKWYSKFIKNFKPDIVIGIDIHCNLIIQIGNLLFFPNIKTLLTTHIDLEETLSDKSTLITKLLLKKLVTILYSRADLLVCVSKELTMNFKTNFKLKKEVLTIYNGLKTNSRQKLKRRIFKKNKKQLLISVARLTEQKDHSTLIKAFAMAEKELPNIELRILSDGPEKQNLKKLAKSLNMSNKIKFLGWVKNIYTYIDSSHVFILSSKREGFAYCLIEAMSRGIPVISTDTNFGPREVLDNGKYGILVPEGDVDKLKNAIIYLLTNPKKYNYYSKMALERNKYFSEEKMLKEYKEIIKRII